MSREIKFRGWSTWAIGEHRMLYFGIEDTVAMGGVEVMQYTGLKDKHGADIYEGDILIFQDDDENYAQSYNEGTDDYSDIERCKIEWDDECAGFVLIGITTTIEEYYWQTMTFEVIGNIYETPKLLQTNSAMKQKTKNK